MQLSIIIPVYNVADYLSECLKSVFIQDLTGCEVICVNDGSTDDSREILSKFQKIYPELIIIDRENGGLSAARNSGLKVAQGEYIYFLDSDDYLYPNVLDKMLGFVRKNDLEVACFNVLKNGEISYFDDKFESEDVNSGIHFCKQFYKKLQFYYPAPVWMYLYKKQFLTNNNLFFCEGKLHEDEDFTPRILYFTRRIALLNIPIQYHRIGRKGAITQTLTVKHLSDSTAICRDLYQFFNQQEIVDSIFYHSIYYLYLNTVIKSYENSFSSKRNFFFKREDAIIMLKCAQSDFERKCSKLTYLSISLAYKYNQNLLNAGMRRIINHIL